MNRNRNAVTIIKQNITRAMCICDRMAKLLPHYPLKMNNCRSYWRANARWKIGWINCIACWNCSSYSSRYQPHPQHTELAMHTLTQEPFSPRIL